MRTKALVCAWCSKPFELPAKEYNRQLKKGRDYFFCTQSCATSWRNRKVGHVSVPIEQLCGYCHQPFMTKTGIHQASFCSRSCASAGSVTEKRRNCARETMQQGRLNGSLCTTSTLQGIACMMRKREAWKYEKVAALLTSLNIQHLFEYPIEPVGVFDLAFPDKHILVEFDGPDHSTDSVTARADIEKNKVTADGWDLVRIPVERAVVIPPTVLRDILYRLL